MRKQRIALENHTYVAPIRRFGGDISPTEQNAPFCRRNESGDNSQASSFPAATWSKNCEKFAFLDPDIEISNGFEISECLMQLSQLDTGHSPTVIDRELLFASARKDTAVPKRIYPRKILIVH